MSLTAEANGVMAPVDRADFPANQVGSSQIKTGLVTGYDLAVRGNNHAMILR